MPATIYRIKIVKPDFEFEAEGDKAFVLEMLTRFESEGSQTVVESSKKRRRRLDLAPADLISGDKSISVSEFIRQLGLKKHTDIVLAFGYYLENFSGVREFTPADVNSCYYDSKMESSNTSQMIIQNIKNGRMMEAKGMKGKAKAKKGYILTRTGETFIETKIRKEQK